MPAEDTDRPTSITVYPNPPEIFNEIFNENCENGELNNKEVEKW